MVSPRSVTVTCGHTLWAKALHGPHAFGLSCCGKSGKAARCEEKAKDAAPWIEFCFSR
jgi:hypothetical protein